jgi:hypothetical protein
MARSLRTAAPAPAASATGAASPPGPSSQAAQRTRPGAATGARALPRRRRVPLAPPGRRDARRRPALLERWERVRHRLGHFALLRRGLGCRHQQRGLVDRCERGGVGHHFVDVPEFREERRAVLRENPPNLVWSAQLPLPLRAGTGGLPRAAWRVRRHPQRRGTAAAAVDFLHCPAGTEHVFVGSGDGPCAVLMIGARREVAVHCPDEVAAKYDASVTQGHR